jgi:AcrR family transcriptional regulator
MARSDKNFEPRKNQIIQAATETFVKYGYEATTNKLIAEEIQRQTGAGFTPQLIYHYFESKNELFRAVMQQFQAPQALNELIKRLKNESPEIFFKALATAYLAVFDEPTAASIFKIAQSEGYRNPEVAESIATVLYESYTLPCAEYVVKQMALGNIKRMHPAIILSNFFAPLVFRMLPITLAMERINQGSMPSREEFIEASVNGFLSGILIERKNQNEKVN